MAKNTKEIDRMKEAQATSTLFTIIQEMSMYFSNAVIIGGLDNDTIPDFITQGLLWDGCIGYINEEQADRIGVDSGWYKLRPTGFLNRWGYPNAYNLVYGNYQIAKSNVDYTDICVLNANAKQFPYIVRFIKDAEVIQKLDISMLINIEASRNADMIPVKDSGLVATIREYYDTVRNGAGAVAISEEGAEAIRNKVENHTQFIADKIDTLRRAKWEESMRRCGIITANNFKRERVQSAEVDASVGESIDYIYTMIDTFNRDCRRYGLPFEMKFNGYADRYDTVGGAENETES